MSTRRTTLLHVLALTALCFVVYVPGLTSIGLVNFQETLRLNSAIEMQERGDWIVPTRRGEAYVKKPPMMYWAEILLADAMEQKVGLVHLRLAAALAGWLGVIATYFVARLVIGTLQEHGSGEPCHRGKGGGEAAWWSALGLASGVLYVRSARTGEIDILLVAPVVVAIGAIFVAWRAHAERGRTSWGAVVVGALACALAALTKGPPPIVLIALAGYGGILAAAACRPLEGAGVDRRGRWGGAIGAVLLAGGSVPSVAGFADVVGVAAFGLLGWAIGWGVARLTRAERLRVAGVAIRRTHPELVLGLGIAVLAAWGAMVSARIGAGELAGRVAPDIQEDLNLLVAESPLRNLGFLAYGLLPMSAAALACAVWLARDRPALRTGHVMLLAWLVLGFAEFSALGKGVARYLTPLWPAVAMLGAWWFVTLLGDLSATCARRVRLWAGVLLVVVGLGQGAWYGYGRARTFGDRSPRDIAAALRAMPGIDLERVGAYRMTTLALEHYLGTRIDRWDGAPEAELFSEMTARIRAGKGAYLLLAREGGAGKGGRHVSLRSRLEEAGFHVEVVGVGARWVEPPDRTPVEVFRVTESGSHAD